MQYKLTLKKGTFGMSDVKVSFVLQANQNSAYKLERLYLTFDSIDKQYKKNYNVVIYGDWKEALDEAEKRGYTAVSTSMENRSKALNAALVKTTGDVILICNNENNVIEFKQSASAFYQILMEKDKHAELVYSDYDMIDQDQLKERKLLEFHKGRLTESWDMGYCLLFRRSFLERIDYCDTDYKYNPMYDLRLKAFENEKVLHISNRFNGTPYFVYAAPQSLDVFAYLKAGKEIAQELETICTEHLKRINAYLAPGQNYHTVEYSQEEENSFKTIASVVIPVFNRPEFIGAAIESVQAQTIQNIECVVVCNGGQDDPTVAEVKRYMLKGDKHDDNKPAVRLIVHDMNNLGLCFNDALASSNSKYYMQLDSDDLLFDDAVEKILEVYEKDEKIGMVIGSYQVFEKQADGSVTPVLVEGKPFVVTHDEWTEENGRNNLLRIGGAGAPRSIKIKVLAEMGWFGMNDSPYSRNYGEDYELVNKVAEQYRIGRVWDPIYKVVRHAGGTDHMIDQQTIDVNDNAKDHMRLRALIRRQTINANQ
ncbi:glycosyltransferase [candidate division KSB1 bacterium]|nr:glycosyltransferase [candidate division KSB1 bacterium]